MKNSEYLTQFLIVFRINTENENSKSLVFSTWTGKTLTMLQIQYYTRIIMIYLYKKLYSISPKSKKNIPTTGVFVLLFESVGVVLSFY